MSARRFVIDGTNVILLHGRAQPELRYVLALCQHLNDRGDEFICFFDANTRYLLQERRCGQREVFERIQTDAWWAERLRVVPGGTEADQWILNRAKADRADVISNDKYRSRARDHRWIWKRRHSLVGSRDTLLIASLGTEIPVLPHAEDYLR